MKNRWERFYGKQVENERFNGLVRKERASLQLGVQIVKRRQAARLSYTKLAAMESIEKAWGPEG